jgi:hypothetical protein
MGWRIGDDGGVSPMMSNCQVRSLDNDCTYNLQRTNVLNMLCVKSYRTGRAVLTNGERTGEWYGALYYSGHSIRWL